MRTVRFKVFDNLFELPLDIDLHGVVGGPSLIEVNLFRILRPDALKKIDIDGLRTSIIMVHSLTKLTHIGQ